MTAAPLVSIVIPTYNRARTVGRAIASCLAQTRQDFEIVVVDDEKSTDDVGGVLAAFGCERIRLISRYKGTAAAARNGGARSARGAYVAFLDSDDEFLPNKLEVCLAALGSGGPTAVYSQTYVDRGVGRMWIRPSRGIRDGEDVFEYLLMHKGWVHPSTVVLPTELARRHPFREDLRFGDDTQFAADLWRAGVRLRMIEQPLAIYQDVGGSQQLSQAPVFETSREPSSKAFIDWIESQRPHISEQAYNAYRARILARFVAREHPRHALGHLWAAYRSKSLNSIQSGGQLMQIFLPRWYRRLANLVAWRAGARAPEELTKMRAREHALARA